MIRLMIGSHPIISAGMVGPIVHAMLYFRENVLKYIVSSLPSGRRRASRKGPIKVRIMILGREEGRDEGMARVKDIQS